VLLGKEDGKRLTAGVGVGVVDSTCSQTQTSNVMLGGFLSSQKCPSL
jgi:hypothetical protein